MLQKKKKKLMQIALTIVVNTASCERSFSSLKRIKSYLRSTMTEERLMDLATLLTEKALAQSICKIMLLTNLMGLTKIEELCCHKY